MDLDQAAGLVVGAGHRHGHRHGSGNLLSGGVAA